jgi:hypothetical protein
VPEPDIQASVTIAAPPEVLYDLVSDVTRMGDWSPENVGGRWREGATGPVEGARFRGTNRRGWRRWSTSCTVVTAERPTRFAFDVVAVGIPAARWTYEIRPEGAGTTITEIWTDHRPSWFAALNRRTMGIEDLRAHNLANMQTTLANLAAVAEGR